MAVTNTHIYASAVLTVTQSTADGLSVTHNGEIPFHLNQWSGASMPIVVIPTASGTPLKDRVANSNLSGSIVGLPGDASSLVNLYPVTADPCFKTTGYSLGTISAFLPSSSGNTVVDECGVSYVEPVHRAVSATLNIHM